MRYLLPRFSLVRPAIALLVCTFIFSVGAETPHPKSPEAQARKAAAPFEKSEGLRLRQDFWSGKLSGSKGKAIRLQFFKGHKYRLFLAGSRNGAEKFHVMVVDKNGNVLGESNVDGPVATVEVKPLKTGTYMILMRAESGKSGESRDVPAVLFYGYR